MNRKIKKILIANRGEIAVRIIKTAKKLKIKTVAIYSPADKNTLHVQKSDESYAFNSNDLALSYLNIPKIIETAKKANADAIHPGYGFLAENPPFVKACAENNLIFIGPQADVMKLMGNKIAARNFIKSINIPLIEGFEGTPDELFAKSKTFDYPILIKAAAGGGGKGMRIVRSGNELKAALEATSREAKSYFGNEAVFVEKYIENPRHIEVQILGDKHGKIIHLFDRECSIQRRYQKIIEEAPSPTLSSEMRQKICNAAVEIARKTNYQSAGTIEFLADNTAENFYFLEMNTRIQVEHPVTELITGIDIVEQQIHVAQGERLKISQGDISINGHAIEARIYAENPEKNFLPSPGEIDYLEFPDKEKIRIDTSLEKAGTIESFFDPMISKLIVHNKTRKKALKKIHKALNQTHILGIKTNINYLKALFSSDSMKKNEVSTTFCDSSLTDFIKLLNENKNSIKKEYLAIAYLLYKQHQISRNAKTVWHKISFCQAYNQFNFILENQKIIIHQLSDFKFSIHNQVYACAEIKIKSGKISFKTENKLIKAGVFQTNKQDYIFHKGSYFSISNKNSINQNTDFLVNKLNKSNHTKVTSPMPGRVIKVLVDEMQEIKLGDSLLIVEAMKMENTIKSEINGTVKSVLTSENENVNTTQILIKLAEK